MDKRVQVLFRENVLKDYPNVAKVFTDLTGNDRARALLAGFDAFMRMTGSDNKSARSVYHLAESYRDGLTVPASVPATAPASEPLPTESFASVSEPEVPALKPEPAKSIDGVMDLDSFLNL